MLGGQKQLGIKGDDDLVRPGFRERVVRQLGRRWNEPVLAVRIKDVPLGYDVPGRRHDGTVRGRRLVLRFFGNLGRGIAGGVLYVLYFLMSGFVSGGEKGRRPFQREILVTGPEGAQSLEPADRMREVKAAWIVCSPTHAAVVDTGPTDADPATAPEPRVAWEAAGPQRPAINLGRHTFTWPDGSVLSFHPSTRTETRYLRQYFEAPDTIHWHGRPQPPAN